MTATTMVMVEQIEVAADIGVHAHEAGCRQLLFVDVLLTVSLPATDTIGSTVDYCVIVEVVRAFAATRTGLIETFAGRVAARCLEWPSVLRAEIVVRKPSALDGAMAGTRLILARTCETTAPAS